jgi:hypothetical protein
MEKIKVFKYKDEYYNVDKKYVLEDKIFTLTDGWQTINENKIEEIESIPIREYRDLRNNLYDLTLFLDHNYDNIIEYTKKYGLNILLQQLGLENEHDYSCSKQRNMVLYSLSHKELIEYIKETLSLFDQMLNLLRSSLNYNDKDVNTKIWLLREDSNNFIVFNFVIPNFEIRFINLDGQQTRLEKIIETFVGKNISIKDGLNKIIPYLGDEIEKRLDFKSWFRMQKC